MGSCNVDYLVVIELLQSLHNRSKHTNLSKKLIGLLLHKYKPFCLE